MTCIVKIFSVSLKAFVFCVNLYSASFNVSKSYIGIFFFLVDVWSQLWFNRMNQSDINMCHYCLILRNSIGNLIMEMKETYEILSRRAVEREKKHFGTNSIHFMHKLGFSMNRSFDICIRSKLGIFCVPWKEAFFETKFKKIQKPLLIKFRWNDNSCSNDTDWQFEEEQFRWNMLKSSQSMGKLVDETHTYGINDKKIGSEMKSHWTFRCLL